MKEKFIPPFRRFVIQNFPFIEADFDALTSYQLWSKVVEYLNKVIKSQNEITAEMQRYIDYINHYQIHYVSSHSSTPRPRSGGCTGAGGQRGATPRSRSGGAVVRR